MKKFKITFWISTGLLSLLMVMSAGMYLGMSDEAQQNFMALDYPAYLVFPLAFAKLLGVLALWFSKSKNLKEWAYAGFFFNFILAFSAHLMANDGQFGLPIIALILLFASYLTQRKISK